MTGARGSAVPSHILYADDILLFCRGSERNINNLLHLFHRYGLNSGQVISPNKSTFYEGSVSARRKHAIADFLGFKAGSLPFTYLGIPIFKGKPKKQHLMPTADRIKSKLASWKSSLLSMAGRVQMVKSVIHSMLNHSFLVYAWHVSLIKEVNEWIMNFIWGRDIQNRKFVTVAWHKVCKPLSEGGLGLRSLRSINNAAMLKLCWNLFSSSNQWSVLLRARVLRNRTVINHHISSFIWPGLKPYVTTVLNNSSWLIGNGSEIDFSNDCWLAKSLVDCLGISAEMHNSLQAKVSDFIDEDGWCIPAALLQNFPQLLQLLKNCHMPPPGCSDEMMWNSTPSGSLVLKEAYNFLNPPGPVFDWCKLLWHPFIPPSKSLLYWRLVHQKLPTEENLRLRGCTAVSICCQAFHVLNHLPIYSSSVVLQSLSRIGLGISFA